MGPFEFQSRTRVVFGEGAIDRLGALATELGFHRTLLVADRGLVDAGHAERATGLLTRAGVEVVAFHDFGLAQGLLPPDLLKKAVTERFVPSQAAEESMEAGAAE